MKRFPGYAAAALATMFAACSSPDRPPESAVGLPAGSSAVKSASTKQTLTILHVNDTHSHLAAIGPKDDLLAGTLGGIARAATIVADVRASGANVLFLHGGDFFEGDTFFNATGGGAELKLLEQMGLDALVIGNHEFNYGPQQLLAALRDARTNGQLHVLAANADLQKAPPLKAYVTPSFVKHVGGVKVGVFGMANTTDSVMNPAPVRIIGQGLDPDQMVATLSHVAADQVAQLRTAGADVIVCLSHLGSELDYALAAMLPASAGGIDVIVGGHDHLQIVDAWPKPGVETRPTIVVQAQDYYQKVGRVEVTLENGAVTSVEGTLLDAGADVVPHPAFATQVAALQTEIASTYEPLLDLDVFATAIAAATEDLTKAFPQGGRRDTGLGDFVADALRAQTAADVGVSVMGFLEERIWAGPVVADDLFRISPYGYNPNLSTGGTGIEMYPVKKFDVQGAHLIYGLEYGVDLEPRTLDFFPQVSGLKVVYDSSRPGLLANGNPAEMKLQSLQVDQCGTGEGPPPCWKDVGPGTTYTMGASFGLVAGLNEIAASLGVGLQPIDLDTGIHPETLNLHWFALLQHAAGQSLSMPTEARITDIAPPP